MLLAHAHKHTLRGREIWRACRGAKPFFYLCNCVFVVPMSFHLILKLLTLNSISKYYNIWKSTHLGSTLVRVEYISISVYYSNYLFYFLILFRFFIWSLFVVVVFRTVFHSIRMAAFLKRQWGSALNTAFRLFHIYIVVQIQKESSIAFINAHQQKHFAYEQNEETK